MHFILIPASEHKPAQFLNLENVVKVIYGPKSESLSIKCVDGSMDTYTGERFEVLLSELNKLHNQQNNKNNGVSAYVIK
jgi:hypothetical protein